MRLSAIRSPIQAAFCLYATHKVLPSKPQWLPLYLIAALLLYASLSLLVLWPFQLLVYQPYLSPTRHIPAAPKHLNSRETWLAREPTPPQLLAWINAIVKQDDFRGLMRYRGIGGGERILVTDPRALKELLVTRQYSDFDRPPIARKRIAIQAGNGLIASGGDIHKAQKRKLLPSFGPRAIKELHPLFWSKARELISTLRDHVQQGGDNSTIEVSSWTSRSALDIIGVAAWGSDFSAISQPDSAFLKSYSAMFDISGGGQFINALALAVPMKYAVQIPCEYNRRLKAALKAVRARCEDAVCSQEALMQDTSKKEEQKNILSLLIQGGIEDQEALVNQMMTILAAGHDTSSLSLAWACYALCKHPEVQKRLRDEVRAADLPILNHTTGEMPALEDLPYLQAVAQEILRLYPSVPVTRREALRECQVSGQPIPEGGHMVSSGWVTNRMEAEWGADAERFDPERFMDHAKNDERDTFAFSSFSHGPRACIGQGFARAEFLIFLAALVGSFEMRLAKGHEEVDAMFGITMSPVNGVHVQLTPLD